MYNTSGRHIVADFFGCSAKFLNNEKKIIQFLRRAAKESNSTILESTSFKFNPQGVTAMVVLKESHISCHTYPEHGFAAVDIYTCGKSTRPTQGIQYLKRALSPKKSKIWFLKRGKR